MSMKTTFMRFIIVKLENCELRMELADSWLKRLHGLSGREGLGDIDGMLFTFPWPMKWRMCMRGMRFPLDFVWIRKGKVAGVAENVLSGTVSPPQRIDGVLEIAAGRVRALNISAGSDIFLEGSSPL
jgi:uncharacterized membrane protein (UPF0127 family)